MRTNLQIQSKARGTTMARPLSGWWLQRKCACGGKGAGGACEDCKKQDALHRSSTGPSGSFSAPSIVHDVLRSPGRPLDAQTRSFFEPRFAHDFSRVRIHTDEQAAASARAVNALAYTVGQQLVFDSGRFEPASKAGQRLIAHELAHVRQQTGAEPVHSELMVTAANDASEYEADRTAESVMARSTMKPLIRRSVPAVQRQNSPGPPQMGGPDWGLTCDILQGKCSFNTPAGDVPIETEHYRCVSLSYQGNCPKECEDELKPLGLPCIRRDTPKPFPGPKEKLECPPGQIPGPSGRCISFRRPDTPIPTFPQQGTPSQQPGTPVPPLHRDKPPAHGTIESEMLDNFVLNDPQVPSQWSEQLDHLAGLLNVYTDVEVHIEGHTDASGTEAINIPLSKQRAEAVKQQLITRKVVNPGRLKTEGFSSHRPQVTPEKPQAQEPRNRRVEVWYYIPPSKGIGEGLRMNTTR